MSETSGNTLSIWLKETKPPTFGSLRHSSHLKHDVIVVGGGISGLTAAYLLRKEGKTVLLLEDGEIGSGETGRTSAHLASALDDHFYVLLNEHGEVGALKAYQSHKDAISLIETISRENNIDCDFQRVDGYLIENGTKESKEIIEKEKKALEELRIPHEFISSFNLKTQPPCTIGQAIRFPNQAQFHPMKYINGLARLCAESGVDIFTHSHVSEFKTSPEQVEVVTSQNYSVSAKSLVVATNVPVNDKMVMFTKLHAYRTYVIGVTIPKGSFPPVLLWDTEEPYHYVRMHSHDDQHDMLIVGGEDHLVGHDQHFNERIERLENWTKMKFPMAKEVTLRWSGQIIEPVDSLGFNGLNPLDSPNVYIITGDSGNGLTNGTLGAELVSDMILGRHNPLESLYNPSRKMIDEPKEYIKENLKISARYIDWLKGSEIKDEKNLSNGQGAILRVGMKKEAVYKDKDGHLFRMSAVCPHMKGVVNWNSFEKTWDCPIHGSRFDRFGQVINGPSTSNLKPFEFPRKGSKELHHALEEKRTSFGSSVASETHLHSKSESSTFEKRRFGSVKGLNSFIQLVRCLR